MLFSVCGKIRGMIHAIPSTQQVQNMLKGLPQAELLVVSAQAGVPVPTLIKIRHGVTKNPGIDTVRKIYGAPRVVQSLRKARKESLRAAAEPAALKSEA